MFVESSEMQTAISRLTSAYITSHIILLAMTNVNILLILSKLTSSNPVHMSAYSVAVSSKG